MCGLIKNLSSAVTVIFCLQVNDFVRGKTRQKDGTVPLAAEILAGGCVSFISAFVAFLSGNFCG